MKPGEYRHPRHAQAAALLRTGMTAKAVAEAVGMGRGAVLRVRRLEGIAVDRSVPVEVLMTVSTVPIEGTDHVVWSGRHDHGTPVMRHNGRVMSAAAVAYELYHSRKPVGSVKSDCHLDGGGPEHCMNPAHIQDESDRQRERRQLRALMGLSESLGVCLNGHDQETHGKVEASLRVYCGTCATERRAANRRISGK